MSFSLSHLFKKFVGALLAAPLALASFALAILLAAVLIPFTFTYGILGYIMGITSVTVSQDGVMLVTDAPVVWDCATMISATLIVVIFYLSAFGGFNGIYRILTSFTVSDRVSSIANIASLVPAILEQLHLGSSTTVIATLITIYMLCPAYTKARVLAIFVTVGFIFLFSVS